MIQRAIVLLLLFGAAINIPAALMAAGNGNWVFGMLHGLMVLVFVSLAVLYSALLMAGRFGDDHD